MINATVHSNLTDALEAQTAITGSNFYAGYEGERRYADENATYYVAEDGSIYYVFTDTEHTKGLQLFHKLTLGSSMNNMGFNVVSIIKFHDDAALIQIHQKGYSRCNKNRKALAKQNIIVTTLAAM